ncbi:MAG: methyltransferase [Ilumatobacteraceae bacterium]
MSDEQYFARQPKSKSALKPGEALKSGQRITWKVGTTELHLITDRGVFSRQGIDAGTTVLIENAPPPPQHGTFLDLGCGSGVLAITMATLSPQATVWAMDINVRAISLTRRNAANNRCHNVHAVGPEGIPAGTLFDVIWTNPPIRIGKKDLHQLLSTWLARLSPEGQAWLVVSRNLGSDSLVDWLREHGYDALRHTSKRGYRVIRVAGRSES